MDTCKNSTEFVCLLNLIRYPSCRESDGAPNYIGGGEVITDSPGEMVVIKIVSRGEICFVANP